MAGTGPPDGKAPIEAMVGRFRRRLLLRLVAARSLRLFTLVLFVWGGAVLCCRLVFGTSRADLLGGLVFLPGVVVVAWFLERRRVPTEERLRAFLDHVNRAGGLLMVAGEGPDGLAWRHALGELREPAVHWHGGRAGGRALAALAFAPLCLLAPERPVGPPGARQLQVGDIVREIEGRIEILEEEELVTNEQAQRLKNSLFDLAGQGSGDDPAQTWEALDRIAERVAEEANKSAEEALAKAASLDAAEEIAEKLSDYLETSTPDGTVLGDLMAEFEGFCADKGLADLLPADLAQLAKEGELTVADLKKLAEKLTADQDRIEEMLERLEEAQLIDGELLERLAECRKGEEGESGEEALRAFLAEEGEDAALAALLAACQSPGRGGIGRGRGDAPMTWTAGTSEEGVSFAAESLPSDVLTGLKDSRLIGISKGAPKANENPLASAAGSLRGSATGGGSARTQVVLPRHRRAVGAFFARQDGEGK